MSEHVSSAWYADFFTELPNEFWRRAVPPEATTAEVDFVEERLGLAPGVARSSTSRAAAGGIRSRSPSAATP